MSVYNLTKSTWVICLGSSVIEEAGKGRHIYENDYEAQTHKHGLITRSGACNGRNRLTTAFRSPSTVCAHGLCTCHNLLERFYVVSKKRP